MPLKMDHHRPISETPLKWRFAGVLLAFCFGLVSYNIETQCLGQSINLVTTASDEDPKPKLIVRIVFCTAKSDIPQY